MCERAPSVIPSQPKMQTPHLIHVASFKEQSEPSEYRFRGASNRTLTLLVHAFCRPTTTLGRWDPLAHLQPTGPSTCVTYTAVTSSTSLDISRGRLCSSTTSPVPSDTKARERPSAIFACCESQRASLGAFVHRALRFDSSAYEWSQYCTTREGTYTTASEIGSMPTPPHTSTSIVRCRAVPHTRTVRLFGSSALRLVELTFEIPQVLNLYYIDLCAPILVSHSRKNAANFQNRNSPTSSMTTW